MRAGIDLRGDFSAGDLRRIARQSDDADQSRRLLAIAVILDGGSRSDATRTGGVGLQVIRDWVPRFNEGGPEALRTRKAPGKPSILMNAQRSKLAAAVEAGPKPSLDVVVRWRLVDLVAWVREEFDVSVSRATLGRELRAMGFRKLSARPQQCAGEGATGSSPPAHAQDAQAIETFKKTSPKWSATSASRTAGRR